MSKTVLMFAGQGAQAVGMGRDLASALPAAKSWFDRANAALGYDLAAICFGGPEPELTKTENAQPGIFLVSWVALKLITVEATKAAGVLYGVQTLLQLLPPDVEKKSLAAGVSWSIPCVRIEDKPRFPWRGMHLDVGRHFFSKDSVKRYIDMMASYKMNTFHWHLTEDQGWRIEIKKYPRLTEIGSKRDSTPVYRNGQPPNGAKNSDGIPHGGFYTQEQIKEIVEYAARRHITIIPEIEMPGHS